MSTTSNLNRLGEVRTQLALCTHAGFGCEKDNAKAWQLIRDASQVGSIQAKAISGRLSASIEGTIPSEQRKELLSWLSEGASSGSRIAAEDLKRLDSTAAASPPQVETLCFGTSENTDIIEHDLIMACRSGDYNLTKHILSTFDGRLPKGKDGDTVLHWLGCFAEENVAEIASMAISRGVNIHDRTFTDCQLSQTPHFFNKIPRGTTALYWAIQQDAHVSVRALLEKGAILDYDSLPVEDTALSIADNPLCCAASFHSVRSLGILCEVTGDRLVNRFDLQHRSPLLNAIDSAPFNDIRHYSPRTSKPNEVALSRQVVTINTLVAHRCDMRLVPKESFSCVLFAAMTNVDVLKTLLELPQCRSLIREPDKAGVTPLARAIQYGQIECFRLLLQKGADPSLGLVHEKMHCIHFCCFRPGKVMHQMAEELLGKFPKCVHAASLYGYTPLHRAAWNGQIEMAELLLRKGADLTSRAQYGFTPLAAAIASKSVPMVEFFLEKHKKATRALVAYRRGSRDISAFEFLLSPGRWSDRASQMGFSDFPGCLDVPFSSTSSDILGVLLDAYDANGCWRLRLQRYLTHPCFWSQSPCFHNDNAWSGIDWAVGTSNSDVVEKLIKTKDFHFDSKQLVGLALRQFWGDDKHHVASEADRLKMLKFIRDFRRAEFENSKNFRVDRSNMFNVFWKLYYRLCGSMAEDQHERWVSDQQRYPRENPLSLKGVGTFRFELQADSTRRIIWAYIGVGYLVTIALFVPYWVYLAKVLTNPLAHSSHATKINIVICILIVSLHILRKASISLATDFVEPALAKDDHDHVALLQFVPKRPRSKGLGTCQSPSACCHMHVCPLGLRL
jgi:ankyrin repeat protein